MLSTFKRKLSTHKVNLQGWKTSRKILVLESDDWGSVRIPSKEAFHRMLNFGVRLDHCPYNRFDKLESKEDLLALFDTLASVRDSGGNPARLTANTIVANPDFTAIEGSGFKDYFYEIFTETYCRYYSTSDILDIIAEGQSMKVYHPQFHGREHLNVNLWMEALRQNKPETRYAFKNNMFGISKNISTEERRSYLSAFDFEQPEEITSHKKIISEGLDIFFDLFKFRSSSFVAPNYTWHPEVEETLKQKGVEVIQGARAQQVPTSKGIDIKKEKMGAVNAHGQVYLIRNVQFEPTGKPGIDWVNRAYNDVSTAFLYKKPAIISTHRLNYMGGMDETNRNENLLHLKTLLKRIVRKFPHVEFMTSDQLGQLILSEKTK